MPRAENRLKRIVRVRESVDMRLRVAAARERRTISRLVDDILEKSIPPLESMTWSEWREATALPPIDEHQAREDLRAATINVSGPLWDRLNVAAAAHRLTLNDYLTRILSAHLPQLS